jgi:hypothetical protein
VSAEWAHLCSAALGVFGALTISKWLNLASAAFGVLGAATLYQGSFAYEQPGAYMNAPMITAMYDRNRRRHGGSNSASG